MAGPVKIWAFWAFSAGRDKYLKDLSTGPIMEHVKKDINSIASISKETSPASVQVSQASDELARLSVRLN